MIKEYRPRLSIDMDEEDYVRLRSHLEHGMQKQCFNVIISDLLDLFDKYGANVVIGGLITKAISLNDVCKLKLKQRKVSNDND